MKRLGNDFKNWLLDLVFPKACLNCKKEGFWLCPDCLELLRPKLEKECPVCRKAKEDVLICPDCQDKSFLKGLWILTDYNPLTQKIIQAVKYEFLTDLVGKLNGLTEKYFSLVPGWQKDFVLLPVPLSRKRYLERGFNQARLLAEMASQVLENKVVSGILQRKVFSKPQAQLSAKERLVNVKGNFCMTKDGINSKGEKIVLVDDVYTTGATMQECARILKENGFNEVWGLVLARG